VKTERKIYPLSGYPSVNRNLTKESKLFGVLLITCNL